MTHPGSEKQAPSLSVEQMQVMSKMTQSLPSEIDEKLRCFGSQPTHLTSPSGKELQGGREAVPLAQALGELGFSNEEATAKIGAEEKTIEPPFEGLLRGQQPSSVYDYRTADGKLWAKISRHENGGDKEIRPWYFDGNRWKVGDPQGQWPLYNLSGLLARPLADVLIVEGEKCSDAASVAFPDIVVVTWAHGANAVKNTKWAPLRGRSVVLWPDNDPPGKTAMSEVAALIGSSSCRLVAIPEGKPDGWDIADALSEMELRDVATLIEGATPWQAAPSGLEHGDANQLGGSILPARRLPASFSQDDLFDRARKEFPRRIEEFFSVTGSRWEKDEYKTLNPLRFDRHIGSFSINREGLFHDFATGDSGDGITLLSKVKGISPVEACRLILRENPPTESESILSARTCSTDASIPPREQRFPFVRADKLEVVPIEWLIKGVIPAHSVALTYSAPGVGKSLVAIDMAACIATGAAFHGHGTETTGAVFIVVGEHLAGQARRIAAWEMRNQSLKGFPLYLSLRACNLLNPLQMNNVHDTIRQIAKETGTCPVLVVIDTLARSFGTGDENSTSDMNAAIIQLDKIKNDFNCSVLVVHHSGHTNNSRARGSSALAAAADVVHCLESRDNILKLSCTKSKDTQPPKPLAFRLVTVNLEITDEDGYPVQSAVLEGDVLPTKGEQLSETQRKILDVFPESTEAMGPIDVSRLTGHMPDTCGKAMEELVKKGKLTKVRRGKFQKAEIRKQPENSGIPIDHLEPEERKHTL